MTRNKKTKVFGIVCIWQQQGVPNLVTCSSYISPENKKSSSIHRFTPHNVHTDTSCDSFQEMITKAKKNIFLVIYIHIFFVGFYLVQPCAICLGQIQVFRVRQNNISVDVTNIWECCIGGMEAYPRNSKEKKVFKTHLATPVLFHAAAAAYNFFLSFFFHLKKKRTEKKNLEISSRRLYLDLSVVDRQYTIHNEICGKKQNFARFDSFVFCWIVHHKSCGWNVVG